MTLEKLRQLRGLLDELIGETNPYYEDFEMLVQGRLAVDRAGTRELSHDEWCQYAEIDNGRG